MTPKTHHLLALAILVTNILAAEHAAEPPVPAYEVKRSTGPVIVDGRLDEAAWQQAATLTLQFPWVQQTGVKQPTTVRLLWDDVFLYLAYECTDTDITARHERRDDPTYEDDAVELFLNPNPKREVYVGLEMNARGVLYDYVYVFPSPLLQAYDLKKVQLSARPVDRGWVLEVAIPLANFIDFTGRRTITSGTVWTANLNRWDGTEPARRLSVWSDPLLREPNPHNPKRFGRLLFVP